MPSPSREKFHDVGEIGSTAKVLLCVALGPLCRLPPWAGNQAAEAFAQLLRRPAPVST